MRHRSKKKILGRERAPRRSLYRQLAINLILHGRITTTVAKAKALKPFAEKLITTGKRNTLAQRRSLMGALSNEAAVKKILTELAPKFSNRPGGYTRVVKLGRRQGDASPTALIEFV